MLVAFLHRSPGVYQVSPVYNGSAVQAAAAGIRRFQDLDNAQTVHYHAGSNSVVQPGWVFVRKVLTVSGGAPTSFGQWEPVGDAANIPSGMEYLEVELPA